RSEPTRIEQLRGGRNNPGQTVDTRLHKLGARRGRLFGSGAAERSWTRVLQVSDQIGQVLRGDVLFQSFRHQRKVRRFNFEDVVSQNFLLQSPTLHERRSG